MAFKASFKFSDSREFDVLNWQRKRIKISLTAFSFLIFI